MNKIDEVKELVGTMTEHERKACLEEFTKAEHENEVLTKNIRVNIEKLKVGFAELTVDDWDKFCDNLVNLSRREGEVWR